MVDPVRSQYLFNSAAYTAMTESEFQELLAPFMPDLKDFDGIVEVEVGRYELHVTYWTHVVHEGWKLIDHLQGVMRRIAAAKPQLFPYLEGKGLRIIPPPY